MGGEHARGAPPVADLVLLGLTQLRHRPLIVGAGLVGDESGVVAEAALAPGALDQRSLAARLEHPLRTVGFDQPERAVMSAPPVIASRRNLAQQLLQVLLVAGGGTSVASGMDSGTAAKAHRLDSRIVADRRLAAGCVGGACLLQRDHREGVTVLRRQLD